MGWGDEFTQRRWTLTIVICTRNSQRAHRSKACLNRAGEGKTIRASSGSTKLQRQGRGPGTRNETRTHREHYRDRDRGRALEHEQPPSAAMMGDRDAEPSAALSTATYHRLKQQEQAEASQEDSIIVKRQGRDGTRPRVCPNRSVRVASSAVWMVQRQWHGQMQLLY
eukprot:2879274-Rhodomonas_salina.1